MREEIQVKGRSTPEVLDVTITHHGPIVNDVLGRSGRAARAVVDRPPVPAADRGRLRPGARAQRRGGRRRRPRTHAVPPLNMLWADRDGQHRLPAAPAACRCAAAARPDLPKPGWTREFEWDGTIPYEELPARRRTRPGFLVTANNRIVDDDYPHHITSEWMTGYRARGSRRCSASASATRSRTSSACSSTSSRCPGIETVHRLSRLHPRSQREIRAIERLKSWDGRLDADTDRGHDLPRVHDRVRARSGARRRRRARASIERYLNSRRSGCSTVVSSPWRFQERLLELWDEGDPTWFASAPHPDGRAGTTSRSRRSSRRSTGSSSGSAATPDRWRWGRVHGVEFAHPFGDGERRSSGASSTARARPGAAQRDRDADRLSRRRSRSRACGDPSTGCSPTSATRAARAGS